MSEVLTVKEGKGSCISQGATRVCLYPAPSSFAQGVTVQFGDCLGLFPPCSQCGLLGEVDDKSKKAIDLVHWGRCCVSCQVLQKGKGEFKKKRKSKNPAEHAIFLKPLISV